MLKTTQLSLFDEPASPPLNPEVIPSERGLSLNADLGTFKDSLRAPIFGWFQYPAGYSFKLVYALFEQFGVRTGADWVYDPFSGTGTTLLCAKLRGINGYGVEAHSFVHWVASVKLNWEYAFDSIYRETNDMLREARAFVKRSAISAEVLEGKFPDLIYKCYHPQDLLELYWLREYVNALSDLPLQNLLKLALTDTLRQSAAAGTGWPYIAPNKNTGDKPPKQATNLFERTVRKMVDDVHTSSRHQLPCAIYNVLGDSRQQQQLEDGQVRLALTSPPYLNNYDYADRTRLETYFWGIANSWGEITKNFRDKLMVAATTQIVRSHHNVETVLSEDIRALSPTVYQALRDTVLALSKLRLTKGGKKDYDLMVALYFNDMVKVIKETGRVIADGGKFCLVLGDSAPYGIHVPTETYVSELGLALGFKTSTYQEFRSRGQKWKANPQRHTIPLREGIVILSK